MKNILLEQELEILRILERNPKISQRELALELGMSLGKVNYLVKALTDKGWVKIQNFNRSTNKLGYLYLLTPKGIAAKVRMTCDFLERKESEYERLREQIEQLRREIVET